MEMTLVCKKMVCYSLSPARFPVGDSFGRLLSLISTMQAAGLQQVTLGYCIDHALEYAELQCALTL